MLTVYRALPGSRSEQALSLLATIAADQHFAPADTAQGLHADADD
jgi:hypothetical protein